MPASSNMRSTPLEGGDVEIQGVRTGPDEMAVKVSWSGMPEYTVHAKPEDVQAFAMSLLSVASDAYEPAHVRSSDGRYDVRFSMVDGDTVGLVVTDLDRGEIAVAVEMTPSEALEWMDSMRPVLERAMRGAGWRGGES